VDKRSASTISPAARAMRVLVSIKRAAHEIRLAESIGCVQCHLKTAETQLV